MGRNKIDIKKIKDERKRQTTFKKRKDGLLKKAMELSILCDVEIAVFMFTKSSNQQMRLYEYSSGNATNTLAHISQFEGPVESKNNENFHEKVDPHLQFIAAHQPNYPKREAAGYASYATMHRQPAFVTPSRRLGQTYLPMTTVQHEQMKLLQEERRRMSTMQAMAVAAQNEEDEDNIQNDAEGDEDDDDNENDTNTSDDENNTQSETNINELDSSSDVAHDMTTAQLLATASSSTLSTHTLPFSGQASSSSLGLDSSAFCTAPAIPVPTPSSAPPAVGSRGKLTLPDLDGFVSSPVTPNKRPRSGDDVPRRAEMKKLKILIPPVNPSASPPTSARFSMFKPPSVSDITVRTPVFPGPFISPRFDMPSATDPLQTPRHLLGGLPSPTTGLPLFSTPGDSGVQCLQ